MNDESFQVDLLTSHCDYRRHAIDDRQTLHTPILVDVILGQRRSDGGSATQLTRDVDPILVYVGPPSRTPAQHQIIIDATSRFCLY